MIVYIVPNPYYNTEQIFILSKASMIMYDFEKEILTIQYHDATEYEIDCVSKSDYELIKSSFNTLLGSLIIRHK